MRSIVDDGPALVRRLRGLRDAVQGGEHSGHRGPSALVAKDPQRLAEQVLAYCRRDLDLPHGMTIHWTSLDDAWGVVYPHQPRTLRLNRKLWSDPHQLVETTAHEALHAARILAGNRVFDAEAEIAATHYGHQVAARWSF